MEDKENKGTLPRPAAGTEHDMPLAPLCPSHLLPTNRPPLKGSSRPDAVALVRPPPLLLTHCHSTYREQPFPETTKGQLPAVDSDSNLALVPTRNELLQISKPQFLNSKINFFGFVFTRETHSYFSQGLAVR